MAKSRLHAVYELGQSVWYDNIRRGLLTSGDFQRLIDDDAVLRLRFELLLGLLWFRAHVICASRCGVFLCGICARKLGCLGSYTPARHSESRCRIRCGLYLQPA